MKFTLALAGLLLMAVGSGGRPWTARAAWRVSQFENVLGTSLELKFAVASDNEAARAEAAALAEIERLDHILSGYGAGANSADGLARRGGRRPCRRNCLKR